MFAMLHLKRIFRPLSQSRIGSSTLAVPKLTFDFVLLAMRISLAMLFATFRAIIPRSMKSLIGETVLITGAGHGIGRELAMQLAAMGCIVVCWDIDVNENRATMDAIIKEGGEVYGFIVDVSKRLEVRETVRMMRKVGVPEITILINNAAVLYHRPFLKYYPDDIERTFSVNVFSHFWTIEAFLPNMLQRNKGHIVCICSMCGIYGVSQKVPYCSSKFALRGLMEALHEELRATKRDSQIRLTTVYPFYVDTGFARDPKYRFPHVFNAVTPKYAAEQIIKAIRRNFLELSIPRCLFSLNSVNRILPENAMRVILDFLANKRRGEVEIAGN